MSSKRQSSTKRPSPKSNSKGGAPKDFKRLKGKVGKRAPSRLNATDTTFKIKSVKVSKQQGVNGYREEVGKSDKSVWGYEDEERGTVADVGTESNKGNDDMGGNNNAVRTITALPTFPGTNGKPMSVVLRLATTHASVKERGGNVKVITDLLLGPQDDSQLKRNLDSDRDVYMSSLYSPLFAPGLFSLLTPVVCKCITDSTPNNGDREVKMPDFGVGLLAASLKPGEWRGTSRARGRGKITLGMVKPFFPTLMAYCKSAMNSMSWECVKGGVRVLTLLIEEGEW